MKPSDHRLSQHSVLTDNDITTTSNNMSVTTSDLFFLNTSMHLITEILLKLALNSINHKPSMHLKLVMRDATRWIKIHCF
jgi:hypothetical protein